LLNTTIITVKTNTINIAKGLNIVLAATGSVKTVGTLILVDDGKCAAGSDNTSAFDASISVRTTKHTGSSSPAIGRTGTQVWGSTSPITIRTLVLRPGQTFT